MKILLVTTSFEEVSKEKYLQLNSHYPLGLAYIHSYLEEDWNNEVKTLFLNDYPYENCYNIIVNVLEEFKPNIVGFNILTSNRVTSYMMINYIEENYSDIKMVLGGIHVSVMYEQILNNISNKVICVLGEGEITFKEIVDGKDIKDIDGIAYYEDGYVIKNKPRELIKGLDALPFPKHLLFMNPQRNTVSMLTSRGCPYRCSFCVLDSISRKRIRYRSPKNVVDEIQHINIVFPQIKRIWIHDDNFTMSNKRAIEICKEIVNRNIRMEFICSCRIKPFTKELVYWLEKAGFIQVLFGIESGAKKIMETCGKKLTKDEVERTIELFRDSNIIVTGFLIMGLYGETDETVEETANFIYDMQKIRYMYYEDIGIAAVYPATELFDISKKNGVLDESYWLTTEDVPWFIVEHSREKLLDMKRKVLDKIAYCNQCKL